MVRRTLPQRLRHRRARRDRAAWPVAVGYVTVIVPVICVWIEQW
jgi:hypothetical protein